MLLRSGRVDCLPSHPSSVFVYSLFSVRAFVLVSSGTPSIHILACYSVLLFPLFSVFPLHLGEKSHLFGTD